MLSAIGTPISPPLSPLPRLPFQFCRVFSLSPLSVSATLLPLFQIFARTIVLLD